MKSDKLIVLDLDQTLFFSDIIEPYMDIDYVLTYEIAGEITKYHTVIRPHVSEFLSYIKKNFEYGIFTTSSNDYADDHCKMLGITNYRFLLSKDNCTEIHKTPEGVVLPESIKIKDLSKVDYYTNLTKIIAIDDNKDTYMLNPNNLIQIPAFYGTRTDDEYLLKLMEYLEDIKNEDNILEIEKRGWLSKY